MGGHGADGSDESPDQSNVVPMPGDPTVVRPLGAHDVESVLAIQAVAYEPRYHESAEAFTAKIAAGRECCFGLFKGSKMAAYLVAVPLADDSTLSLDSSQVPGVTLMMAMVMFIHDLAVHPDHRGRGLGDVLLVHLHETAMRHGVSAYRLVAVQNSVHFWQQRGFVVEPVPPPAGYGPEAVVMSRR